MAQPNDRDGVVAALTPEVLSPDRTPDVAIFTAPALGVVFHWWAESNRRWTERDRAKAPIVPPVILQGGDHPLSVDSDRD
jgi:hypothetical protein